METEMKDPSVQDIFLYKNTQIDTQSGKGDHIHNMMIKL